MVFPEKVQNLTPYTPSADKCPIHLDANESFLTLTEQMKKDIADRLASMEYNRYPDSLASELCEKFANFYKISPEYVTAGNGSDELINIIVANMLSKGDKILTFSNDFSMYNFYAHLAEVQTVTYQKNDDLTVDVDKVINICNSEDIKMLIFSNPCNPTSLGITRKEIKRLITSVDSLVVLDEAYMDFWDQPMLDYAHEYDNLIVLKTLSKAIGLAALRVGFAVANEKITNILRAVKSPYNVNTISQTIASCVLSYPQVLKENIEKIVASRNRIYGKICDLAKYADSVEKVYPTVTNFVFFKSAVADRIHQILVQNGICVRHMGNFIRITAGTDEENEKLLYHLKQMLDY